MATSIKGRLASTGERVASALEPRACALVGAAAGIIAGWFGMAAGLILGFMLDVARIEARTRRRIEAYLERPDEVAPGQGGAPGLPEALPGYSAAACLALRGDWPGLPDLEARRALWDRYSFAVLPPIARARREAERLADVAARSVRADLPALARLLATSDAPTSRRLLADWAFAAAALGRGRLDAETELELRAALGDCGVGAEDMLAARLGSFPGERDPWTVLGLAPGASRADVKRAYRRLSRLFHPDSSRGARLEDDGERFRELREAYVELTSSKATKGQA
jgi:hypothetical protein